MHGIGRDPTSYGAAQVRIEELSTVSGAECVQISSQITREREAACGRAHARNNGRRRMKAPSNTACIGVQRGNPTARRRLCLWFGDASPVELAAHIPRCALLKTRAPVSGTRNEQMLAGLKSRTVPRHTADDARTEARRDFSSRLALIVDSGHRRLED